MERMNTSGASVFKPIVALIVFILSGAAFTGVLLASSEWGKPITAYKTVVETEAQGKLLKIRNDAIADMEQARYEEERKTAVARGETDRELIRAETSRKLEEIANQQRLAEQQVELQLQRDAFFTDLMPWGIVITLLMVWVFVASVLFLFWRWLRLRMIPDGVTTTRLPSVAVVPMQIASPVIIQPLMPDLRGVQIRDPEVMRQYSRLAREIEFRNRQAAISHGAKLP